MEPTAPSRGFTANYEPSDASGLNWKKWLSIFGLTVLGMVIYVYVTSPMIVTVTGSGEVSVPATDATISFTLSATDANSPAGAIAGVSAKAKTMRAYLTSKGVPESDIIESMVTAVPAALVTAGGTGYQAVISMAAKTVHISDISTLVSDLYSQGAYVVAQPVLSVDDQSNLDRQAFESAMKDADSQARHIGLLKWKFIRKIINITQATSANTSTSTAKPDTLMGAKDPAAANNGVFKIGKAVSVTYKMW